MAQENGSGKRARKGGESKAASSVLDRAEPSAPEYRSDWDNPFGHEPSVPIIYEPY